MVNHNVNGENSGQDGCLRNKETVSILFVCLGNICRSPAAEGIMKKKLEDRWPDDDLFFIDSAGIGSWHEGELPDRRMREHGKRHGYDFCSRARQVRREDFGRFDYIIGMDNENMSDLMALARSDDDRRKLMCMAGFMSRHPEYDTIPDPYYGNAGDFELAIELIEDACDGLLKWLDGDR